MQENIDSPTSLGDIPGIPPFPDTVHTAPLVRISLRKLLNRDPDEEERLWRACCDLGFFLLDLRRGKKADGTISAGRDIAADGSQATVDGDALLKEADELFDFMKELFELPVEEKNQYDLKDKGIYFGYVHLACRRVCVGSFD